MSTFYQATPVGIALMHALETMLQEKLISETQARKIIVRHFKFI